MGLSIAAALALLVQDAGGAVTILGDGASDAARACYEAAAALDDGDDALAACDAAVSERARSRNDRLNRRASLNNRGLIRFLREDYVAAATDFSDALQIRESAQLFYNRGLAYERLGKLDFAKRDFTRAVELSPNDDWDKAKRALARVT